jgi:hypothetical protein
VAYVIYSPTKLAYYYKGADGVFNVTYKKEEAAGFEEKRQADFYMKCKKKKFSGFSVVKEKDVPVTEIIPKTGFVLTSNNISYITIEKDGNYCTTANLAKAKVFSTKEDAEMARLSMVEEKKKAKTGYFILNLSNFQTVTVKLDKAVLEAPATKPAVEKAPAESVATVAPKCKKFVKTTCPEPSGKYAFVDEQIKSIHDINDSLLDTKKRLEYDLKNNKNEIVDIYHYIEFYDLNACDGYKIYKKLQDALRERREIKDSMDKLEAVTKIQFSRGNQEIHAFDEVQTRTYWPRYSLEMFGSAGTSAYSVKESTVATMTDEQIKEADYLDTESVNAIAEKPTMKELLEEKAPEAEENIHPKEESESSKSKVLSFLKRCFC